MKRFSILLGALLVAFNASADKIIAPPMLQYAAKFVCGSPKAGTANEYVAASGKYFTAVNVHNPSEWETASFVKKFAVGLPQERVGQISKFIDVRLRPDETMQIDCGNIWKHLSLSVGTFVEGFVVIQTRYELDVVSVYTAANGPVYEVSSIETERVPFRVMKPCPATTTDISTGVANWQVIGNDPSGGATPRSADIMSPLHPWGVMSGLTFVSFSPSGGTTSTGSSHTWNYETCFCTCLVGDTPQLTVAKLLADDVANVYLNACTLGSITGGQTPIPGEINAINTAAANPSCWKPGQNNCLRLEVKDTDYYFSGFGLSGAVIGTTACQ